MSANITIDIKKKTFKDLNRVNPDHTAIKDLFLESLLKLQTVGHLRQQA